MTGLNFSSSCDFWVKRMMSMVWSGCGRRAAMATTAVDMNEWDQAEDR
jgi:hypothetical protein